MSLHISSQFDSGNILVRSIAEPLNVQLEIQKDAGDEHFQWFHFRVSGARGVRLRLQLMNAGEASYPDGWLDYRVCVSVDRKRWLRSPTSFENGRLVIDFTPDADSVYFAYFAPYSSERHLELIASVAAHPLVRVERLGSTVDGRDLDLLVVGEQGPPKKPCWIIARQHPGETMAEWCVEGLLERLLDAGDPIARELLKRATFYIVPNMNPDGAARGHLRCNAAGANLNREWKVPSLERSPEVFHVREKMFATGVKFALDVHGDEALPYNFIAGAGGVADLPEKVAKEQMLYEQQLQRVCPDFQTVHGYPAVHPGKANLTIATNWIASHFGALSMTLEQPFKDTNDSPYPAEGWSPERARKLGRANLDALWSVIDSL